MYPHTAVTFPGKRGHKQKNKKDMHLVRASALSLHCLFTGHMNVIRYAHRRVVTTTLRCSESEDASSDQVPLLEGRAPSPWGSASLQKEKEG